jgi:hypothetical protein
MKIIGAKLRQYGTQRGRAKGEINIFLCVLCPSACQFLLKPFSLPLFKKQMVFPIFEYLTFFDCKPFIY